SPTTRSAELGEGAARGWKDCAMATARNGRWASRATARNGRWASRATALAAAVAIAAGCTASPPSASPSSTPTPGDGGFLPSTTDARYRDPATPTAERVEDLLSHMDLADKIGQMTQGERGQVSPGDAGALRLGSVLSGGGSTPQPNTAEAWADMHYAYQQVAVSTLLGNPSSIGVDPIHGHNTRPRDPIF